MPDCNLEKTVQGVIDLHLQVVESAAWHAQ